MSKRIEKVTAFVTRNTGNELELLLFEHPNAGIQIPAGTVNPGETPEEAAVREVAEETGLTNVIISQYLGADEEILPDDQRVIAEYTKVYARPDLTSFDWAYIRPGITVTLERKLSCFSQIVYQEFDRVPNPQYVTMSIKGWVPDDVLADTRKRHFFHLLLTGQSKDRWTVYADNHRFPPYWAPLNALPDIIPPQDEWLVYLGRDYLQQETTRP
jgi:8-oxo-dGTP pyrophosphatase MutT (NUDIX family)